MSHSAKGSVAILGVPVDNLSMEEVIRLIEERILEGGFHQIATANVDFLIKSIHDEELYEALCRCDMVLADGMPLIWASRIMGTPLRERVAGADLVPRLVTLSAQRGYRIFLLGAQEKVSLRAANWMDQHYPGVCAGRFSPNFRPLEEIDNEEILRQIEEARPDILLVAFGNPKQEKWLAMNRHRLRVPVCIGVGASLDFLSGAVARAPRWMQSNGMEWIYRLMQEPTRLAKRYFGDGVGLLCYLTVQLIATAAQAGSRSPGRFEQEMKGSATVFRVEGGVTSQLLSGLEDEVRNAIFSGRHIVIDLSQTVYLGPDALGSMIHLMRTAHRWNREMWLTGLRPFLKRLMFAARLRSQFRVAPRISDALRRIEPTHLPNYERMEPALAFCRIGDQMIPIRPHEVNDLYLQVGTLVRHNLRRDRGIRSKSASVSVNTHPGAGASRHQEILKSLAWYRNAYSSRSVRSAADQTMTAVGSR